MPIFLPGPIHGFGYGGDTYGYSPYGAASLVRPPIPTTGGYGGAAYGYASYGSVDVTPPRVVSVNSLDGFRVEILFSEAMSPTGLIDPSFYTFASVHGAPVVATSGVFGTASGLGFTSVIVSHTGTTLGGQYILTVSGPTDIAGNPLGPPPTNSASFSALGDIPIVQAAVPAPPDDDGRTVVVQFLQSSGTAPQAILTEAAFSPGVDSTSSYEVTTAYPVAPTVTSATQTPAALDTVTLDITPMTSTLYNLVVGPSEAFTYKGNVLPNADPNFTAIETGAGTSSPSSAGLLFSKTAAVTYGWYFGDDSGRVVSGSSFRADFTFDTSGATITPPMFGTSLATLSVCDGAVQVDIILSDVAGTKVLDVVSGGLIGQVPATWDSGTHTVSLVRNMMGTFYSVLFDGVPLLTFAAVLATGAPTFPGGALTGMSVILSGAHAVGLFKLPFLSLTASSTVFTSAWNFVHGVVAGFTGSAILTNDRLLTDRGPLVRGWGDATPATKEDVAVRLDGTAVEISSVNPYHGVIFPTIPIPLAAPGVMAVETDYKWFANPPMEFAGLNTRGLTLNKWDRHGGHHTAGAPSPVPAGSEGAPRTGRFPIGLMLAPMERRSPVRIGHRYHGLQRDYSALLNEPTSLLLNIDPHSVSIGGVSAASIRETGYFDGLTRPGLAETPWVLSGTDAGGPEPAEGYYRLVDDSSGPYGIGATAIYEREADLTFPTSCTIITRMMAGPYTLDGVFTGLGFGVHDGARLVLVGLVVVDGVRHLGLLTDAEKAHLEEGWELGPKAAALGVTVTQITVPIGSLPTGLNRAAGVALNWSLFRIPSGPQAGVYQIAACGMALNEDGLVEINLADSTPLPIDPTVFGASEFDVLFDVPWNENLSSYRLVSSFPEGSATLYVGGALSGFVLSSDEVAPYPADTALILPEKNEGVFFWGSVSRRAESVSVWDIVQYASDPKRLTDTVQGISVFTEMGIVPQNDPHDHWFIAGGFGYSEVDSLGDRLLLKSTSASSMGIPNLEFGYTRIEPYLTPDVTTDIEGTLLIESGTLGAGSAQILVRDTVREARASSLLIARGTTTAFPNRLIQMPSVSVSGLVVPSTEGWVPSTGNGLNPFPRGQQLVIDADGAQEGYWLTTLPSPDLFLAGRPAWEGTIAEMRVAVESYTQGATDPIGPYLSATNQIGTGDVSREVVTALSVVAGVPGVTLADRSGIPLAILPFDWTDGEPHTYRTLIDPVADIVVVVVDDVVLGNAVFSDFTQDPAVSRDILFGIIGDAAVSTIWHSVSATPLRPVMGVAGAYDVVRTFGVWLGGDPDLINNYAIPRTDTSGEPNTALSAMFVAMDWTVACRVRLYLDPSWGVGLYRPDLPLPPTATGDFVTETTDPTAAWVNVEYDDLPLAESERGIVSFGALDPRGISQQRWDSVRYRIRGVPSGFGLTPQGMVLNRATPLTSGEFIYDVTPEVVTVRSLGSHVVSVWSSNMVADRVFVVESAGAVIPSASWEFNADTQLIILDDPLPNDRSPVTITFAPGRPVTNTYLCSQPISGSVTLLNEGTPPMPLSRDSDATREVVSGSVLNDPWDVLDDPDTLITNDPKRTVKFSLGEDALYADLDTCTVEDGESVHITTLCDAPGPGTGFAAIGLDGHLTANEFSLPEGPAGTWGKQSPSIKGSATHFDPAVTLVASGGMILGGNLGPGTAILHPNMRGPNHTPPPGGFGINQDFGMALALRAVVTDASADPVVEEALNETFDFPDEADNTAPSGASPANGYGVADGILADYAAVASHLGPAGGLTGLTLSDSLLAGGAPLNGSEFILVGGAQLPRPMDTVIVFENPNP